MSESVVISGSVKAIVGTEGGFLLDIGTARCFTLNTLGACVWQSLAKNEAMNEVVASIAGRYAVPESQVRVDAGLFVDQLVALGLATRSGETITTSR